MGRHHKKSRLGCKVCKQRKVKCDETKPECTRCAASGRECSYLGLTSHPRIHVATPAATISTTRSHLSPALIDPALLGGTYPSPWDDTLCTEQYSLVHMELMFHFRDCLRTEAPALNYGFDDLLNAAYGEAFRVPYLMDEVLGLAAAHRSTTAAETPQRSFYLAEATKLQTRALSRFGQQQQRDAEGDQLAPFIFSLLLGQHVLFDVFTLPHDLSDVLDRFVHCIHIHHGIKVTASQSWPRLGPLMRDHLREMLDGPPADSGGECDELLGRVATADGDTGGTYAEAIALLQYLFDSVRASGGDRRMVAVQEWPVRISEGYVELLRQRRPEALAVLAHYAVLLHGADDYWAVAGSGRFLVGAISRYLGDFWADWLRWPAHAVGLGQDDS